MNPSPLISCEISDGIAVLTRHNPPVNATTLQMTAGLRRHLETLAGDSRVRVLIMTGAGDRSFCAGSDIREFAGLRDADAVVERKMTPENAAFTALAQFPRPTIAALNGSAYGGGLEMALCCDLIIAEEGQEVGFPEAKLGLFPGSGGPVRAMRRIGEARTKELCLFGDPIPVETALGWGLINKVVAPGGAQDAALEWARRLAALSVPGLTTGKRVLNAALDGEGGERLILDALALFREAFQHPDAVEGEHAFLHKRPARFPSTLRERA